LVHVFNGCSEIQSFATMVPSRGTIVFTILDDICNFFIIPILDELLLMNESTKVETASAIEVFLNHAERSSCARFVLSTDATSLVVMYQL
jgi:hypothetical protein